ncbi:putative thiol methyltransferase 2 [Carex rostrata]
MRSIFPTLLKSPQNSSALLRFSSVGSQTLNPKPSASDSIFSICTSTSRLMKNSPISGDVRTRTDTSTGERYRDPSSNPKVSQLREVIGSTDPTDAWEKSWEEGIIPWDLGKPTPIVTHLVQAQSLPKGRVLVPGCGTGYDVVALAGPERYVVGLDISDTAIKKAKELSASSPNKEYFSFLVADFFNWNPSEPFNLIFDYTAIFLVNTTCLFYVLLNKINVFFFSYLYQITGQKEGPPFNNDVSDYEEVLNPLGFKKISIEDNELAVKPRKGREKLVRWKRSRYQSNL